MINKTLAVFLIIYMAVCFTAGYATHAFFFNKPKAAEVTKHVKETYAFGVPDTISRSVVEKAKFKIQNSKSGYQIKSDNKNLTVTDFKIHPPIDHGEVDLEANVTEKYITRTDTVHVTEKIFVEKVQDEVQVQENGWSLIAGSRHEFVKDFEPIKYAMLQYQHKVWFFFISGSTGIQNKFNEGLNNIQIAANLELSVPIN